MRPITSLFLLLVFLTPLVVSGQTSGSFGEENLPPVVPEPYAGKVEPRIGSWFSTNDEKLRLDIGTSVDLLALEGPTLNHGGRAWDMEFGVDFFTWTQLRSAGRFKFPVEAVDYYFGVYGAYRPYSDADFPLDVRLRLAHISAHLVDGDPGFIANPDTSITYSREFVDLLAGRYLYLPTVTFGLYAGATWLFSTIPSSIDRITPYAGISYGNELTPDIPLTLRLGYEFRLNTELVTIGEHQVRMGWKFASLYDNGVALEVVYSSGRSPFGQYFNRRYEQTSIGFLVEH